MLIVPCGSAAPPKGIMKPLAAPGRGFAQEPGKRIVKVKLRTQANVPAQFSDHISKGPDFFSHTRTRACETPQNGVANSSLIALCSA